MLIVVWNCLHCNAPRRCNEVKSEAKWCSRKPNHIVKPRTVIDSINPYHSHVCGQAGILSRRSMWFDVLKMSVLSSSHGVGDWWKRRCYRDQSALMADGSTSQSNCCSRGYLLRQRLASLRKISSRMRMMGGGANEHALTDVTTSDGSGDVISSRAVPTAAR